MTPADFWIVRSMRVFGSPFLLGLVSGLFPVLGMVPSEKGGWQGPCRAVQVTPSGRTAPARNTIGSQLDMEWQPHLKKMYWTRLACTRSLMPTPFLCLETLGEQRRQGGECGWRSK